MFVNKFFGKVATTHMAHHYLVNTKSLSFANICNCAKWNKVYYLIMSNDLHTHTRIQLWNYFTYKILHNKNKKQNLSLTINRRIVHTHCLFAN